MTEIGRRSAILVGTAAFAISILTGIFSDGDLVMVSLRSVAAGLIFGICGLIIGNLMDGYVFEAAKREVARTALRKELEKELLAERETSEESEELSTEAMVKSE